LLLWFVEQACGEVDGGLLGFGVEVGEGFGEGAEQVADAVGVVQGVAGVHGFAVQGLVVLVEADGVVEQFGRGVWVGGDEVVGEQEVCFDAPLADAFAVRFDPFVVAARGEGRGVQAARLAQQTGAGGAGGEWCAGEQVA